MNKVIDDFIVYFLLKFYGKCSHLVVVLDGESFEDFTQDITQIGRRGERNVYPPSWTGGRTAADNAWPVYGNSRIPHSIQDSRMAS
jgi:hypothetical protein